MKTVKDIQTWFENECNSILSRVPKKIINMAKDSQAVKDGLVDHIVQKTAFRKEAVSKYINTLI